PDAVQRSLVGEIIQRIERTGLKIAALKLTYADEDTCWKHYNKDDAWFQEKGEKLVENRKEEGKPIEKEPIEYGKDILRANIAFMTSGPLVAMVIQGNQAVGIVQKLVGATEPLSSDVGTIRGDYTIDSLALSNADGRAVRNLVHASDEPEEAEREIPLWFNEDEVLNYNIVQERILYDVDLDGIWE
ncbi:MAG: nucleoside-diphosphate kinase, partial [Candidatus Paceibacteria bacterium]